MTIRKAGRILYMVVQSVYSICVLPQTWSLAPCRAKLSCCTSIITVTESMACWLSGLNKHNLLLMFPLSHSHTSALSKSGFACRTLIIWIGKEAAAWVDVFPLSHFVKCHDSWKLTQKYKDLYWEKTGHAGLNLVNPSKRLHPPTKVWLFYSAPQPGKLYLECLSGCFIVDVRWLKDAYSIMFWTTTLKS